MRVEIDAQAAADADRAKQRGDGGDDSGGRRDGTDGTLDTCIALRTIQLKDGVATLQAGAGIVADSDPEEEHREGLRKIAALQRAVDRADAGGYGR